MKQHETYISRCIQIAKNGLGTTAPNPMVGCVIVHKNTIIGEGFTSPYGGNHAEVNAIHSVKDKSLLKESTLYVTLEPCAHYGKTPPCADTIVSYEIPNVVIGCKDNNALVSGQGIAKLKAAGCHVTIGVLEAECKMHHKRFFTFHNKKRPYVILKWAESQDGYIAPKTKKETSPVWITNEISRQLVHKWRAEEQAILVGTNTVLEDNPSLTVRDWTGKQPIRIILDKHLELPQDAAVFNNKAESITICSKSATKTSKTSLSRLEIINWDLRRSIAYQICEVLHKLDINSVIIEGGAQTLQTFIYENIWDEARVFTGNSLFKDGVKAPEFFGRLISEEKIETDTLKTYANN